MNNQHIKPVKITDLTIRDAHQSLFATRMRIEDMLPIAEKMDQVGFWSIESWGGATFDTCIRFLGEDPWERLRILKKAMPNTPQQMLLRGQNILGYRHYGDDVVDKFVERAAINGMDVFRTFDAMNDPRNVQRALRAVINVGAHAQATLCYTTSRFHTLDTWIELAKIYEDMGVHSIAIKDMAGLLKPYEAYALVNRLKAETGLQIHVHSHATTGLSTPTLLKAIEAGVDVVDTVSSPLSMTYSHSATETIVTMLQGTNRETGLDLNLLEEIAAYFRTVRPKYAKFEGEMQGVDSRILVAQIPGGMLTNMESQLRQQGASDRLDDVLAEVPRVRADLGYLPLVTPTSQIVGTQAVVNVLSGERYKAITKETQGVLLGEYGKTPTAVNKELQERVAKETGRDVISVRPADLIDNEWDKLSQEVQTWASDEGVTLRDGEQLADDVLIYALFPNQVGPKFLKYRGDATQFEPKPWEEVKEEQTVAALVPAEVPSTPTATTHQAASYIVTVDGQQFTVQVGAQGEANVVEAPSAKIAAPVASASVTEAAGEVLPSPLAGNIMKICVNAGEKVQAGQTLIILEAMKMETEIKAPKDATIVATNVKEGDAVEAQAPLLTMS